MFTRNASILRLTRTNILIMKYVQGYFQANQLLPFFNNKIDLFEKAEGQGPGVFRLLGFRFLGYDRPPETLK